MKQPNPLFVEWLKKYFTQQAGKITRRSEDMQAAFLAGLEAGIVERDALQKDLDDARVVSRRIERERDALRADAERYRLLRKWLEFEGLLWCSFCKPPDAPIGVYWVLRTPALVKIDSCVGYGQSEEAAIDAAMKEQSNG